MSMRKLFNMTKLQMLDTIDRQSIQIQALSARLAAAEAENVRMREACEQGKARCQNFLNGLLPACGPMTMGTAAMIASIQNDFKESLGHDFESEAAALAPATEKGKP